MSDSRDVLDRPAPGPDRTLTYGPSADHVIDVWQPADDPTALVVVVHGGFWRAEYDRRHTYPMCVALAAEGYAVAAVEYRRTGQVGGGRPGTFDDVAAALDLLVAGGARTDAPIVLVGHSAGGHLAVWASLRHRQPADSPWYSAGSPEALAGVVSLAGVCDLDAAIALNLDDGAAVALLGDTTEAVLALTDPMRLAGPGVPTILLHGDADTTVPIAQSRVYAKTSAARLRELPGVGHYELIDPLSTIWPQVLRAVAETAAPSR
ncbi:alpha/beta hydrolase [Streptomyces sp. SID3343]|uniref:alpha/beta hydrolase n=1 Tax=Streptomyces sp. SID3343 TaxID=2690260 RepID=UPI0013686558|nr:alpha/beta hydrolase [Streptomyces sp. SID3343]MYW06735.1 alpha/beta fold hydrolase [Streptomyces sp. SID3343]